MATASATQDSKEQIAQRLFLAPMSAVVMVFVVLANASVTLDSMERIAMQKTSAQMVAPGMVFAMTESAFATQDLEDMIAPWSFKLYHVLQTALEMETAKLVDAVAFLGSLDLIALRNFLA